MTILTVLGDPGIEDRRRSHAECDAAHRAGMWRVRIGADDDLAWQRVRLENLRMTDRFGTVVAEPQLTVQLDPLRRGEFALLLFELQRDVE